jgi:transposase
MWSKKTVSTPSYEDLLKENSELRRRIAEQERQIAELKRRLADLEAQQRRSKRQGAPFSRDRIKNPAQRPGRKPGEQYGQQATRTVPPQIDETVEVPCPLFCEACGGPVSLEGKASQYQTDLPPIQPRTTEFVVHHGRCQACGRRVQGRHPRQSSDALTVGAVQLGPTVVSWGAVLNKTCGLSYGKIVRLFGELLGLQVARSSLCRALARLARRAAPTYEKLKEVLAGSPVVYPDETGWRIGGRSAWLWVFTNQRQTVYHITPGRGFAEAKEVLGANYGGVIVADGWAPYRRFEEALYQTCLAHLLRRCKQMLERLKGVAARFPQEVMELLKAALALRQRRDQGRISPHGLRIAIGRLKARLGRLLEGRLSNRDNRRLAKHLSNLREALFVFLARADVEATNWPAEQGIRPAVVNRKSCAGNRTDPGARTQEILMSLLRTCEQMGLNPWTVLSDIFRDPDSQPYTPLLATDDS